MPEMDHNLSVEELSRLFLDFLDGPEICLYRYDGSRNRYLFVSDHIYEMLGWTAEEFMARDSNNGFEDIHPEDFPGLREAVAKGFAEHGTDPFSIVYEYRRRHKKGSYIWIRDWSWLSCDEEGKMVSVMGAAVAWDDQRMAEEALAQSERRYKALFEHSPISLWEEDLTRLKCYFKKLKEDGVTDFRAFFDEHPEALKTCAGLVRVRDVNPATLRLLQASSKEELFGGLSKILTPKSFRVFREEMIHLAEGGTNFVGEISHFTLTGEELELIVHFNVSPEHIDDLGRVVVSLLDITEQKRLLSELSQARHELEERVVERTGELAAANTLLAEEAAKLTRAREHVRQLTRQLIRAQESERRKIARDLHDHVAQDLSSLKIACETFFDDEEEPSPLLRKRMRRFSKVLGNAISEVRALAYGLMPPGLDQLGLSTAMDLYLKDFSTQTGIKVDFSSAGMDGVNLDADTEINLYRLLQESLSNVKKHARADTVTVRLLESPPGIILRVEDNGRGFDVEPTLIRAMGERRMGIQSMRERVGLLGGSLSITSAPGRGTRIRVEVPSDFSQAAG